jgi:transcriptional regulator with XRE-family HTH domain
MTSFGDYLRREREDRGVTLDEIAEITRISPCLLEYLETDRHEALPPMPIVKGFLRSYAAILGMPQEDTVLRYMVFCHATPCGSGAGRCNGRQRLGRALRRLHGFLTGNDGNQVF